jgi:Carboxypeptidase regulatory-like domain
MLFLQLPQLHAQVDTGVISGTVTDASGAVVPGASVIVRNTGTNQVQDLKTGPQGLFVSLPLYPGEYSVEVSKQGFKKSVQQVRLSVSQRIALNFALAVGATTQVVTVRSSLVELQTEKSTLSSLQSATNIGNLPLNGPNFAQLMGLAAGVMPAQTQTGAEGGGVPITMKRAVTGYSVNGLRLEENSFLVDGILDNENHNGLGILIFPPPDAIEEFREENSVADAQFGRGGGGTVNLTYKSGTQHYHGDLYEFVRNSGLDARNFFDATIPEFRRNQFGGSLGGPLLPRQNAKTFFFVDYQGVRTRRGQTFISTVPTLAARGGDFSQYSQEIYDPTTDTTLPNGQVQRTQFPNNMIPSSVIDPVGQNLINLYPAPNLPGTGNNFSYAPVFKIDENDEDFKINHTLSDKDSMWGRYTRNVVNEFDPGSLPAPAVGGGSPSGTTSQPGNQVVLSETHVFSPTMVNQARVAWTRLNLTASNMDSGKYLADSLGIPGANVQGNLITSGLPLFNISGFQSLGENGYTPAIIISNDYQYNDDLTFIRGRHTFKAGFQFIRLQYNAYQASSTRGAMSFSTAYTSNPASPAGTGLGAADLLLGRPISGSIQYLNGGVRGFRQSDAAAYFADTFKVTKKLTLDLGVRYENFIGWPWTEAYDRMYQFVPAQNTVLLVGTNGIPRSGVHGRNNDFAPRIGLAYSIRPSTVFRMAFGTFYSAPQWDVTRNLASNPPEAIATEFSNSQFDFAGARPASQGFDRPAAGTILGSTLHAIDPNSKTPTTYQWNAAIEQTLPASMLLTVAYVGTKGTFLEYYPNVNQPVPGTTPIAQRRPYPLYQTILRSENVTNSSYNGLQVTVKRPFAHGLDFLFSYTYSHAIDISSGDFGAPMDTYNIQLDRGNAGFDVPNRLVASGTYLLPFSAKGLAGGVVNGWQMNGILSVYSGLPFSVGSSTNTLNIGSGTRANRLCNGALSNPTISDWFDLSCFGPPGPQQWGTGGSNILRGPHTRQLDFSLFKNFSFGDTRRLQFRAEAFNIFNTPLFNNPNSTAGSPSAGTITSAGAPLTYQRTSREIQLALRLYF